MQPAIKTNFSLSLIFLCVHYFFLLACSVHTGLAGHHCVQLLGRGVGPGSRVDQVHSARLLDAEREHEVLDPEVRDVGGAGDVQVLEGCAALAQDTQHLVVAQAVQHHVPQLFHLFCMQKFIKVSVSHQLS